MLCTHYASPVPAPEAPGPFLYAQSRDCGQQPGFQETRLRTLDPDLPPCWGISDHHAPLDARPQAKHVTYIAPSTPPNSPMRKGCD